MMAASLAHHPLAVRLHHAGCMVICSALSDFDIPGIASLIARCRKTHRHFLLPKYGPWPLCGMLQHGTLSGMPLLPSLAEKCCNHLPAAALLIFSFWALSDAIVCGQLLRHSRDLAAPPQGGLQSASCPTKILSHSICTTCSSSSSSRPSRLYPLGPFCAPALQAHRPSTISSSWMLRLPVP